MAIAREADYRPFWAFVAADAVTTVAFGTFTILVVDLGKTAGSARPGAVT
ncbi:hypothetical protein PLANPX_2893 [Lacipirellula parvula]|uniref:Uncharacterized protein n=1 Tax=Lacipirellula parvula TaxID=2650471 RepID=A0A5K7XEI0_9BACT|nr:hypothetical protein PLANPX_2893 [Lacipirellula parvula]